MDEEHQIFEAGFAFEQVVKEIHPWEVKCFLKALVTQEKDFFGEYYGKTKAVQWKALKRAADLLIKNYFQGKPIRWDSHSDQRLYANMFDNILQQVVLGHYYYPGRYQRETAGELAHAFDIYEHTVMQTVFKTWIEIYDIMQISMDKKTNRQKRELASPYFRFVWTVLTQWADASQNPIRETVWEALKQAERALWKISCTNQREQAAKIVHYIDIDLRALAQLVSSQEKKPGLYFWVTKPQTELTTGLFDNLEEK